MGAKIVTPYNTKLAELKPNSFEFKCYGALAPVTAIADADVVNVKWEDTNGEIGNLNDANYDTATSKRTKKETLNDVILKSYTFEESISKTWADKGMEAVYKIGIKIKTGTAPIDAGNWILVEFGLDVAPKLNAMGGLYCEQGYNDSTPSLTYCEFSGPRRVKILSRDSIMNDTKTTSYYYIYGVA